jgi:outer membrane protein assembly factor BamB
VIRLRIAIALAGVLLAGCSTLDALNPFSGSARMAELKPIPSPVATDILWQASVGGAGDQVFMPAVAGASVYAASRDGTVVRLDEGREVWRVDAGRKLSGGVAADGKLVVVGTQKGEVLTFDAAGKPLWEARLSSEVLAPPAIMEGQVIVRSGDNRVFALDILDGKRRWVHQRATPALSLRSPAGVSVAGGVVLAGFPGGKLVAINPANGGTIWETTVALPRGATELERIADVVGTPVVSGRVVCAAAFQGRIGCFDLSGGNALWTRDLSSVAGLDTDGRAVFVSDEKGAVHALDRANGASLWKQDQLTTRGSGRPLALDRYVIVGDAGGAVHVLRREDGAFAARLEGDGSPVAADPRALGASRFVVQTRKGNLYAVELR